MYCENQPRCIVVSGSPPPLFGWPKGVGKVSCSLALRVAVLRSAQLPRTFVEPFVPGGRNKDCYINVSPAGDYKFGWKISELKPPGAKLTESTLGCRPAWEQTAAPTHS